MTDAGISALGTGCGQLQSINFAYCNKMTDAGISALGVGCGQLQSINFAGCNKVTDAGILALSAGCGQPQSINLKLLVYQRWVLDVVRHVSSILKGRSST